MCDLYLDDARRPGILTPCFLLSTTFRESLPSLFPFVLKLFFGWVPFLSETNPNKTVDLQTILSKLVLPNALSDLGRGFEHSPFFKVEYGPRGATHRYRVPRRRGYLVASICQSVVLNVGVLQLLEILLRETAPVLLTDSQKLELLRCTNWSRNWYKISAKSLTNGIRKK